MASNFSENKNIYGDKQMTEETQIPGALSILGCVSGVKYEVFPLLQKSFKNCHEETSLYGSDEDNEVS